MTYTNAATIIGEDFRDTEDLDGLFSGFDPEEHAYDPASWTYEGVEVQAASGERDKEYDDRTGGSDAGSDSSSAVQEAARGEAHGSGGAHVGTPKTDPTLKHPRCVFQVLKRHFARYTAEMVEQVCGIPRATFDRICELVTANSGRERTTAWVYASAGPSTPSGVQYIRGASILQMLLGNIGRPGGGILALRGHASIQGSTDIPTLFDLLPGYIPMPHAHTNEDLDAFLAAEGPTRGSGGTCARTWSACSRRGGATPRPRRTTSASTTCRGSPATTAPTRPCWRRSTGTARATSCWARTRPSARPTASCSGSAWPTWTGWSCATSR